MCVCVCVCVCILLRNTKDHNTGGRKSFTNAFSSNLKTVNLKTFPNHDEIYT